MPQNKTWRRPDADGAREAEIGGEIAGGTTQAFDLHFTASVPVVGKGLEQVVLVGRGALRGTCRTRR
jgi:hypothetical protein